ncbi:MAG TPA: oligosaccharide flippase family protein [Pyrinomonadaceae bacterium]
MDSNPTQSIAAASVPVEPPPRLFSTAIALTLVTRLLMLAGALGTSIIVAHWLGAGGLGSLAVINVTVALAVQLGCAGLPSANTYYISQDRRNLGKIWSNSLLFAILAGTSIAVGIMLVARFRPTVFGSVPASLITIAALSVPFQLLTLLGLNVFLAIGQIDRFNLTDAATQLTLLLNAVFVLVVFGTGLYELVSVNTATAILVGVIVVLMVHSAVRKTDTKSSWFDWEIFRRMIRYGVKFHICVVAAIVIVRADLLMVNNFRGPAEAGVYAVAGQMASLLVLLPGIVATLLFPRVAAAPDPSAHLTMRVTRHIAFVMFFVCLGAVAFAFALPLIYGPSFTNSTLQLLILIPGVYLFGIEAVLVQHFTGSGLPLALPVFWLISLLINLAFNFVLIPDYGATAAAVVSTATYALIFALVAVYFRVKTGNALTTALVLRPDEARQLLSPARLGFFSE